MSMRTHRFIVEDIFRCKGWVKEDELDYWDGGLAQASTGLFLIQGRLGW